jgi:hypothetical protein
MIIGAVVALLWILFIGASYLTSNPESAPQQAAGAAMTMVGLIFPYVIFRIITTVHLHKQQEKLIELLSDKKSKSQN